MSDIALPAYTQAHVKDYMIKNGASGTIYAFAFPESRQIVQEIIDGGVQKDIVSSAVAKAVEAFNQNATNPNDLASYIEQQVISDLSAHRAEYTNIFEGAWTGRQDAVDDQFFDAWKKWSAPVVTLNQSVWNNRYPTAGASEGLREAINTYGSKTRAQGLEPVIHVFDGEYEGFEKYASSAKIRVVKHNRDDWRNNIDTICPNDQFFISQPSAIDGNFWEEFDEFAETLYATQPSAELMLDLTYVGSVARDFHINGDHPNIPAVFFSLSKPFGVYYHRIGGLLSREPIDGLFGNKWFKNIQAIRTGTALLERSGVYDLPRKYEAIQREAIENVSRNLSMTLTPSDVLLFATAPKEEAIGDIKLSLLRGPLHNQFMRVCITPEIAKLTPGGEYLDMDTPSISLPSAVNGVSMKDMQP